jgi:sugar lactone lactonase YvrE
VTRAALIAATAGLALAAASAPAATAATAAPGVAVHDVATGFAHDRGIGPVGVALDARGRIYVTAGDAVYRFGPEGGAAGAQTRLAGPLEGRLTGLAFDGAGRLYLARRTGSRSGGVLELDPETGAVLRTVANDLPCPTGLASDPRSGDLFVSTVDCGPGVLRLAHPSPGRATASVFTSGIAADGLTFDRDGTLYVAHAPDAQGATVSAVDGTGARRGLAAVDGADGTALGSPATAEGTPPFLVVNRHDGRITRVDLDTGKATDLVTGGTRGDLSAVGPDGCLYATQTDRVIKVTAASGACQDRAGAPLGTGTGTGTGTATGASAWPFGAGLVPTTPPRRATRCGTRRTVTLRLRGLRRARILLGRRVVVRSLGPRALGRRVVLRRMPARALRLTIVGVSRKGRRVVWHRHIRACR